MPNAPTSRELNGAFTVTAAGAPGLTPDQLRSQRFVSPTRAVRMPAQVADPELSHASGVLLASNPDSFLCDVSAARLWNLPLPAWIALHPSERRVSAAQARGARRPQRRGVRGRRLTMPADHLGARLGLRVTTPARTWLDCAEFIPVEHLVAMGDATLRRRLATPDELAAMVRWARRRRGVLRARRALPLLDPRSESPGESLVRAHLLLAGVPRPECNLNII